MQLLAYFIVSVSDTISKKEFESGKYIPIQIPFYFMFFSTRSILYTTLIPRSLNFIFNRSHTILPVQSEQHCRKILYNDSFLSYWRAQHKNFHTFSYNSFPSRSMASRNSSCISLSRFTISNSRSVLVSSSTSNANLAKSPPDTAISMSLVLL